MTIFELLNLRYEYETIVKDFKISSIHKYSDLKSLKKFVNIAKPNSDNYKRAIELAETILKESNVNKRKIRYR